MTIFPIRTVLKTLAVLVVATTAAAQDRPNLLTSIEVKQLVARGDRGDHGRLRDHFAALAAKYEADAKRYRAMAQLQPGNPNHPGVPPSSSYGRKAAISSQAALTVRELSTHHGRLANGEASTAPADASGFEHGKGAPSPSEAHLRELASSARTPADHQLFGEQFTELAATFERTAQKHATVAMLYRTHPNDRSGEFAVLADHCERLAKSARTSTEDAAATAAEQRRLAERG